jgi:tetratricopeptide (TPR) repeat protein
MYIKLGDREGLGHVLSRLGAVAEFQGDDVTAHRRYTEAWGMFRATKDDSLISFALSNLSDTAYRQGDLSTAATYAQEALRSARASGEVLSTVVALGGLAYIELAAGRIDAAVSAFDESLRISLGAGYQSGIANAISGFAAVARVDRKPLHAVKLLAAAETVRINAGIYRSLNQRQVDTTRTLLQADLEPPEFSAAWREGQAMTFTDALDLVSSVAS